MLPSPIESLVARRVKALPKGLQEHIHRAQAEARLLAQRHRLDVEKALLATLAHDVARATKGEQLLQQASDLGVQIHPVEHQVPILLHGPVGAELLRQVDGLEDDEIYEAVYWHSTAHPSLRDTAKVVFLADKMDPRKAHRFPQMPKVRELAMESLDEAIVEFLSGEMTALIAGGGLVHPASVDARNALLMRLQEKAAH